MKKYFLIFFLLLFSGFSLFIPAQATTENLYVDGFTSVNEEWDETGASPWLNDNTGNYISTNVDEEWHEEFTFANSGGSGNLNEVRLYLEINGPSARNDFVNIDLHDGTSWNDIADQDPDGDDYVWYGFDVISVLDTFTKINASKLRVQYQRSGSPSTQTIYIRRSYVYVDYTLGGNNYFVDLTQGIQLSNGIGTQTDYEIEPSQGISLSSSVGMDWTATTALSQDIEFSSSVGVTRTMSVALTQGIGFSNSLGTQTDYDIEPSQGISLSTSVGTGWSAKVDLTQGIGFSSSVAVTRGMQVALSQGIQVATSVATQTAYHIATSLNIAFSSVIQVNWSGEDPANGSPDSEDPRRPRGDTGDTPIQPYWSVGNFRINAYIPLGIGLVFVVLSVFLLSEKRDVAKNIDGIILGVLGFIFIALISKVLPFAIPLVLTSILFAVAFLLFWKGEKREHLIDGAICLSVAIGISIGVILVYGGV